MDDFQFYKENYLTELQRKHDLDSSISIPIGILSVAGSVIFAFIKELKGFERDIVFDAMIVLLAAAVVTLLCSVFFLIRSYFNYSYRYVPTSSEIKKYNDDLTKFYEGDQGKAKTDLESYLISEYAANTHTNSINNDSKAAYLHKAKSFMIGALISLFFASLPYFVKFHKMEQTQKIEIVNSRNSALNMEILKMNDKDSKQSEPKTQPETKPTPPPSRSVKESQQPQKTPPPSKEE